uniref:Cytochrome P450 74B44 n=1 Tax=Tripterygium wilfordii TaxID=458696 RepID=A0A8T8L8B7_TRIWF|nr:cytochrome P450 74B44 [Tripterygium wilfordii]
MAGTTMMTTKMMSSAPGMTPGQSVTSQPPQPSTSLPLRTIPGSYGWPLLGPISDRLDYFWFQGPEKFFKNRIEKHQSTVFRTNVPPSFPFFRVNPNVIAVLDCKSFAHMFDMDIVEKKNILVGDFMPSVKFTGNIRVCAYLDTAEPQHAQVKNFTMDILKRGSKVWVSEFLSSLDTMCYNLETTIKEKGSASFLLPMQKFLFEFLCKAFVGADPSTTPEIAKSGHFMIDRWLALQLLPTVHVGVLQPLEEIFLHSFSYPFFLVGGGYKKLQNFILEQGKEVVERGQKEYGLSQEETVHNLLFTLGFNAFGGFSLFLPGVINRVVSDETGLQEKLVKEVREKGSQGLSFDSVKEMELVQSVVYETLRLDPPVPIQYARARRDFQLSSHDSVFDVKKGELLCGFQQLVMKDPKVFDEPDTFKPDRFVGEGKKLLNYLYWSNGPQSGSPSESNKQCAGKDHVTLSAALFLAYLFSRYDSISGDSSSFKALVKAT